MATRSFEVKTYEIFLLRKYSGIPNVDIRAIVAGTGANGESLAALFYEPGGQVPDNYTDLAGRTVGRSFLPVSDYTWYIDMLRNESPVYATLDDVDPSHNRIWCGEPVGEGETLFTP